MKCYTWGSSYGFQSTFSCNLRQIEIYDNKPNQEGKVYFFFIQQLEMINLKLYCCCFYTVVASSGALIQ